MDINYTGRTNAELVVMYDNKYNVSVVASLCGTNKTTFIVINQSELIGQLIGMQYVLLALQLFTCSDMS